MKYLVTVKYERSYEVDEMDTEDAKAIAMGYLLEEIDQRNVAYDEIEVSNIFQKCSECNAWSCDHQEINPESGDIEIPKHRIVMQKNK